MGFFSDIQNYHSADKHTNENIETEFGTPVRTLYTELDPGDLTLEITESEHTKFVREVYGQGLWGAWEYKNTAPIFTLWGWTVHWNNLLGWKIDESAKYDTRAMIANRIAFYFEKEKEC